MNPLDESTRHYCEQQAERAGAAFRLARQFLPVERAERAVVLTAFIETIEAIATDVTDPGIAATKFQWWIQALQGGSEAGERHPLIVALRRHDQLSERRAARLQAHVGAVGSLVDPQPVASGEALFERLAAPGALRSLIVADVDVDTAPRDSLAQHGAVSIALRQLARDMPDPRPTAWWVPMDWRARFAGARFTAPGGDAPKEALVAEFFALLLAWQSRADEALVKAASRSRSAPQLLDALALESGLRVRWFRRVALRPSAWLRAPAAPLHRRDAWFAWRRARRVVARVSEGSG